MIGPVISHALHLARRVLNVCLHQALDRFGDGHHRPGPLRPVVHEDVITLLRVLVEVEDLRCMVATYFSAPFQPRLVSTASPPVWLSVITPQVEHGFVIADTHRTRSQLVFGKIEPFGTR